MPSVFSWRCANVRKRYQGTFPIPSARCASVRTEKHQFPVNQHNEAIAPAVLNQDTRATEETVWLERTVGKKRLFEITGLVAHPMYPFPEKFCLAA